MNHLDVQSYMRSRLSAFPSFAIVSLLVVMALVLGACSDFEGPATVGESPDESVIITEDDIAEGDIPEDDVVGEEVVEGDEVAPETDQAVVVGGGETSSALPHGVQNGMDRLVALSTLIDQDFESMDDEVDGEIEDLLIDLRTGQILYALVEYGGFLEIGDTELPLPMSAFLWQEGDDDLRVNISSTDLENFPDLGDDWPAFAGADWDDQINTFWRDHGLEPGFDMTEASDTIVRASSLIGYPVQDIGYGANSVNNALVDLGRAQIAFLVIDYGNALGVDDLTLVPFSAFNTSAIQNELVFGDDFDSTILETAPRIDTNITNADIDRPLAPDMHNSITAFWNERGYSVDPGS